MNATTPSPGASTPDILAAWPRRAQWALAVLLLATLLFIGGHVLLGGLRERPADLERHAFPTATVNLNDADHATLRQLPEVGDELAGRIEEYRREHGRFRSVDELANVHGIGRTRLARLRPWVHVDEEQETTEETTAPAAPPPGKKTAGKVTSSKKAEALTEPVDVNEASFEQLRKVPWIGPVTATSIIETRKQKPFESVDDLVRVPGIKGKTLDKIRPFVTVTRKGSA